MRKLFVLLAFFGTFSLSSCAQQHQAQAQQTAPPTADTTAAGGKVVKTEAEWRKQLTPQQYDILREHGTERPFTGQYWNKKDDGTYVCGACGAVLFTSDAKFESECGWPSFYIAADNKNIILIKDTSFGMVRTEVRCARCGSHLGHVFEDGPAPTGLRYCINSASLFFKPKEPAKK